MPTSDTPTGSGLTDVVHGASDQADLVVGLRQALAIAMLKILAQGATIGDIETITCTARRSAHLHPARSEIDLALREVFGGFRPAFSLQSADHAGVRVAAFLRACVPPSGEILYRGLTRAELAQAYSPRASVPDMGTIFTRWREDGAQFRTRHLTAELRYGPMQNETLDLYVPAQARGPSPLWIFVHGGFWQALDKTYNAQFAAGMLANGFAVAMLDYTLAPPASLGEIVREVQAAVVFLAREAEALGIDGRAIHIAGHSAGGHLAAMIACLPEAQLIRSSLALSGLFDLAPLALLPMGRLLAFDTAGAIAQFSPQHLKPLPHVRVGVAVGGLESGEFQRQSQEFAEAWTVEIRIIPDSNHFSMLDGLVIGHETGDLLEFALKIARA